MLPNGFVRLTAVGSTPMKATTRRIWKRNKNVSACRGRKKRNWPSAPAKNLLKGFGDRTFIEVLSFWLPRKGIVGIIGPNGVGKTTLFKTIVGLEELNSGELKVGETVQLSYVDQTRG